MATHRARKVSVTARRIRTSSPPSLLSPLLVILLIPPLDGLYRLRQTHPAFTYYFSAYLIFVNAWTCVLYRYDKAQSRIVGKWRVSEKILHFCELAGGWPAALFSQRFFRHKTHKVAYQAVFWVIVLGHEMTWLWLLRTFWKGVSN
jgi:uncharacterized membrane protein YsdA (DUF1294 family)